MVTFIHRGVKRVSDKSIHTIQLGMILLTALVLIIVCHDWISPNIVFTSMVAGISGIVGARIASNGYNNKPPSGGAAA